MDDIWQAAREGDVGEVEGLVGQDPGLLNSKGTHGFTPLMIASFKGHVEVVRWLVDHGAAIDERDEDGATALYMACSKAQLPVVRLLVERGADSTSIAQHGVTPFFTASIKGHLEVVRFLLGHPSTRTTVNYRNDHGETALWLACLYGRGGVVRALLAAGADPTIPGSQGLTPMAVAKLDAHYPEGATAEGRRECAAALEVRSLPLSSATPCLSNWLRCALLSGGGRMRSGPTCYGRPGRWRMRLRASRRRRWWNRGREARASVVAWRRCRRS
jgi:uncharacterized protein